MGGRLATYQRLGSRSELQDAGLVEMQGAARKMLAREEGPGVEPRPSLSEGPSSRMRRIIRSSVLIVAIVGIVCLHSFLLNVMVDIAPGVSNPDSLKDLNGAEQLWDYHERSFTGALKVNPNCAQDGSICICSSHEVCHQWTFQVGDVLVFEPAYGVQRIAQWLAAGLTTMLSGKDAMHVAAVSEVNSQTPEGIMVVEALKPPMGFVQKNSLRVVIHRWPLIGFWIRRADPSRFPLNAGAITTWSNSVVTQPYDKLMVVPFFRRWITHGRFIKEEPDATEKHRAIQLYRSGGPGMWVCSQLIAWLLAFPGGININNLDAWPIKKMQDFPADFLKFPIWDGQNTHIHCYEYGCYLANPR